MTALVYKNYLLIAYPKFDNASGFWIITVDISWRFDGDRGYKFLDGPVDCFRARDEAEQFGFEMGKEWIDKRVK